MISRAPMPPSILSTSSPSAGSRSVASRATAVAARSATPGSSSMLTSPKFAGARTAVFPSRTSTTGRPLRPRTPLLTRWTRPARPERLNSASRLLTSLWSSGEHEPICSGD